ncbi:MAG: restriction endonuclease [Candidatus Methylumidiphilus sp.]
MFTIEREEFIFRRHFISRAHPDSIFNIEIFPGIWAEFGEPKSKLHSKRFFLTCLRISRDLYSENMAQGFWRKFHVKYINSKTRNKKLPHIYRVIGSPNRLIKQGYIAICEPRLAERDSFISQNTYEYWSAMFGNNSGFYVAPVIVKEAIPALLNKIHTSPSVLTDMPSQDWRVFEDVVAEIFNRFGYEIVVTKKTRDGGKDVIALRKQGDKTVERLLIECKHWKNKIDVNTIRSLVGVAMTEDELPSGVILATTSTFTSDAKNMRINQAINQAFSISLALKDYKDILDWIDDYNAIGLTPIEIEAYIRQWGCKN